MENQTETVQKIYNDIEGVFGRGSKEATAFLGLSNASIKSKDDFGWTNIDHSMGLQGQFVWEGTEQGWDFWHTVHCRLKADAKKRNNPKELRAALSLTVQALDSLLPHLGKIPADIGLINEALLGARPLLQEVE